MHDGPNEFEHNLKEKYNIFHTDLLILQSLIQIIGCSMFACAYRVFDAFIGHIFFFLFIVYSFIFIFLVGLEIVFYKLKVYVNSRMTEFVDVNGNEFLFEERYNKRLKRKSILFIITTIAIMCFIVFKTIYLDVQALYREKVWCKDNYTGISYTNSSIPEYEIYNMTIVDRETASNLISPIIIDDKAEKYAVIYYNEELSPGYSLNVCNVEEKDGTVSVIMAISYPFVGGCFYDDIKICLIPVSNDITNVKCEWRSYNSNSW